LSFVVQANALTPIFMGFPFNVQLKTDSGSNSQPVGQVYPFVFVDQFHLDAALNCRTSRRSYKTLHANCFYPRSCSGSRKSQSATLIQGWIDAHRKGGSMIHICFKNRVIDKDIRVFLPRPESRLNS
jgi:hypothetical protein